MKRIFLKLFFLGEKRSKRAKSASQSADKAAETSTIPTSASPEGFPPLPPSTTVPPDVVHGHEEENDTTNELMVTFQTVKDVEPGVRRNDDSKLLRILNQTGDTLDAIQGKLETGKSGIELVKPAWESDTMQTVREGINKFADTLPGILKALNEVAKLHPFIEIAVSAFRVVVELDQKRRDNDKKIAMLFVEMRDMMKALLQLRNIKDPPENVGPTETIEGRMQALVTDTADDIKKCANACDTCAKRKLIVKVIKGSIWEDSLKGFIGIFVKRRADITFALSIHVGISLDEARLDLKDINRNVSTLLAIFSKIVSPGEEELAILVKNKGGPEAVMNSDDILRELLKFKPTSALQVDQDKHSRERDSSAKRKSTQDVENDLAVVKQELFNDSPKIAIKNNWEAFEQKFDLQHKALLYEIDRMVRHGRDHVIEAFAAGPHDRILDPDIHAIWKDMWPGHVKARHFVLALRDYYGQEVERKRKSSGDTTDVQVAKKSDGDAVDTRKLAIVRVADEDEWALEWINLRRMQAIVEAFDDDASGFITITEVNHFTESCPAGWSLPHWLAYWAIGWQMTATKYRDMIVRICANMFAIQPHIHPKNRNAVENYLETVWKHISTLTSSFGVTYHEESLEERFKTYIDAEEQRLRHALETVKYRVDAMDMLMLVTGPGRIEKHIFPLLWLLLRRDFEIIRLCQSMVIHEDELWYSAFTIRYVLRAVVERHDDLQALFKQQKLDPGTQFKTFASEMFNLWHDSKKFWSLDNLQTIEFLEIDYSDPSLEEEQNINVNKFLNYPTKLLDYRSAASSLYPPRAEDIITKEDLAADGALQMILGRWNGYEIEDDEFSPMMTFCLHASEDREKCEARGSCASGGEYHITGEYKTKDDGEVEYTFTRRYTTHFLAGYWTGTLTDDGNTLSGKWVEEKDDQEYIFIFKRVSPEILVHRPHPEEFTENRASALWKYALAAVHSQVQRRLFSWSYLKARRDFRTEYLGLLLKQTDTYLTHAEFGRLSVLNQRSTFNDVQCFTFLEEYRKPPPEQNHRGIACDHCGDPIHGTRVVCMECGSRFTFDFCDNAECMGSTIETRDDISSPHLPTHDLIKIRTPILFHYREIGKVLRNAKAGLERAKALLEMARTQKEQREETEKLASKAQGKHEEIESEVRDEKNDGELCSPRTMDSNASDSASDSDLTNDSEVDTFACLKCKSPVSQPCFYCVDCPEESNTFICQNCDEIEGGFSHGENHLAGHNLVRCMKAQREEESESHRTGRRLDAVEHQLEGLTIQMQGLTSRMDGLTGQMERIEKLLQLHPLNVRAE